MLKLVLRGRLKILETEITNQPWPERFLKHCFARSQERPTVSLWELGNSILQSRTITIRYLSLETTTNLSFTSLCQANLVPYKHIDDIDDIGLCQDIHDWFTLKVRPGKIPPWQLAALSCSTRLLWKTVMCLRGFHRSMQSLQIHRLDKIFEDFPGIWKMPCKQYGKCMEMRCKPLGKCGLLIVLWNREFQIEFGVQRCFERTQRKN